MKNGKDNPVAVRLSRKYIKFLPFDENPNCATLPLPVGEPPTLPEGGWQLQLR